MSNLPFSAKFTAVECDMQYLMVTFCGKYFHEIDQRGTLEGMDQNI